LNLSADFSSFTLTRDAAGIYHFNFSNFTFPRTLSNAALMLIIHFVVRTIKRGWALKNLFSFKR